MAHIRYRADVESSQNRKGTLAEIYITKLFLQRADHSSFGNSIRKHYLAGEFVILVQITSEIYKVNVYK